MAELSPKDHLKLRQVAVRVLADVLSRGRTLEDVFHDIGANDDGQFSPRDRAWLKDVTFGVLRWKGKLDAWIDLYCERKRPGGNLRRILEVAAFQICVQDRAVPEVVTNETVELVKQNEGAAPARFVNAVCRKLVEERGKDVPKFASDATWASLPQWLWDRLNSERGRDWTIAFAEKSLSRPPLWVRVRDGAVSPEIAEPGAVAGSYRLTDGGRIENLPGFQEGALLVQDLSNQRLVADMTQELRDRGAKTVLDFCAAPGGKTVGLAWNGFQVTASDRSSGRLKLLHENLARTGLKDSVTVASVGDLRGPFDAVWVDAPCSGTGVLRRHPEIRWQRHWADVEALVRLQQDILTQAQALLAPNGILVYSVCSVLRAEGAEQATWARQRFGLTKIREWDLFSDIEDGFYSALFVKS